MSHRVEWNRCGTNERVRLTKTLLLKSPASPIFTFVVSLPFSSVQNTDLVRDPPPQLALHALHSPLIHLEEKKKSEVGIAESDGTTRAS